LVYYKYLFFFTSIFQKESRRITGMNNNITSSGWSKRSTSGVFPLTC